MEHEPPQQQKWEGKVCAWLRGSTPDQVWPLIEDFFNLHKWFPSLSTCYGIEGLSGQPGCVRYCAGFSIPSTSGGDHKPVSWSKERLVAIDPMERSLSYEIIDSNIGFNSYMSKMRMLPGEDVDGDECKIEWSFMVDPMEGWKLEDLVLKYELGLQIMAKRMEEALQKSR